VPDDDLVLDDFRNVDLNKVERLCLPFFSELDQKRQSKEQAQRKPKRLIFDGGPTGAEMRRRDTGCGCTVVGNGHRRNNITIQHRVTLVIAYRNAAENNTHENLEP